MTLWPSRPSFVLSALVLAWGTLPVGAAPAMRAGVATRPLLHQGPRALPGQGGPGFDAAGRLDESRGRGERFGYVGLDGDDLGYGLAGGLVGAALARPDADGPVPFGAPFFGAPPPGGRFAGADRFAVPPPCVRPQVITIGRGVRAADKVRVVYGAPPCGS